MIATECFLANSGGGHMEILRRLAACVLAGGVASAAGAEEWLDVASAKDMKFEARSGSFERSRTKGGKAVAAVLGRARDLKSTDITFEKWYVSEDDCIRGYGKLVTLTMNGEYKYETDYVAKGGNIASAIGDFVCGVLAYQVKARDDKGL